MFAQGSRSQLAIQAQPDFLTPAGGDYALLPFRTHGLDLTKDPLEDGTIRADREVTDVRHGTRRATGPIEVSMRYGDPAIELLMQSAMFNVWSSGEMTIGTQQTFLSIEDQMLDIGAYRLFTGMAVGRWTLALRPNEIVLSTFEMVGRDMVTAGSSAAGTVAPYTSNEPMDAFSGVIYDEFPASGQELAIVTSLDLVVDNGLNPTFVLGDDRSPFLEYGRGRVTGQLTLYCPDLTYTNRFLNEQPFALQFTIADPLGNSYAFYLPRVKLMGASLPVQGEQSRTITAPFTALRGTAGVLSALRVQK